MLDLQGALVKNKDVESVFDEFALHVDQVLLDLAGFCFFPSSHVVINNLIFAVSDILIDLIAFIVSIKILSLF